VDRAYKVVDVFTATALSGNPVAVVLDAEGLDGETMQRIAAWTRLSETTFVLPPSSAAADYQLRIFTPVSELPFAGHPTLGSAHALVEAGRLAPRDGRLVQQCTAGFFDIQLDGTQCTFTLPDTRLTPLLVDDREELELALRTPVDRAASPARVDVGPVWIVASLGRADTVLKLEPDLQRLARLESRLGVTGTTLFGQYAGGPFDIEVRSFAPASGIPEDPVCGSGNAAVAAFRRARGLLTGATGRYVARQGRRVGRDGQIRVHAPPHGAIAVGGHCVTVVEGRLRL
jgi:PhzF family phenazine biosynthesis protein